ncbi:cell envelope integrity protein TolA [Candidatus Poribacteria bacterium]|nr:cell envelope integrity protein TolA [Candidatus Poribacteria bacterium]
MSEKKSKYGVVYIKKLQEEMRLQEEARREEVKRLEEEKRQRQKEEHQRQEQRQKEEHQQKKAGERQRKQLQRQQRKQEKEQKRREANLIRQKVQQQRRLEKQERLKEQEIAKQMRLEEKKRRDEEVERLLNEEKREEEEKRKRKEQETEAIRQQRKLQRHLLESSGVLEELNEIKNERSIFPKFTRVKIQIDNDYSKVRLVWGKVTTTKKKYQDILVFPKVESANRPMGITIGTKTRSITVTEKEWLEAPDLIGKLIGKALAGKLICQKRGHHCTGCYCDLCGLLNHGVVGHDWERVRCQRDVCKRCGTTSPAEAIHNWNFCRCKHCGKTREIHDFREGYRGRHRRSTDRYCSVCGCEEEHFNVYEGGVDDYRAGSFYDP